MKPSLRFASLLAFAALGARSLTGCPGPEPEGDDLFRVAVSGVPGGSLLSVWAPPSADSGPAFLAGGFVGVDPARLAGTGMSAGRLVEYTPGRFVTRCRADAPLWWVHGVEGPGGSVREVWAAGENGTVLRYRDGRCETLPLGLTFPEGAPTLWGLWAQAPDDVWLVGGSAQPTGPKGVLLHYDGRAFTRPGLVPERARGENLYKIARSTDRYVVVGSEGVAFVTDGASAQEIPTGVTAADNRLFTASCDGAFCAAVGGVASGLVLTTFMGPDSLRLNGEVSPAGQLPGLNGVFVQDAGNVFAVGVGGFTMHFGMRFPRGWVSYVAPRRTEATLHGVGGHRAVVLAAGGELDERTPMQRAVVLVRGDASAQFTFDGRAYAAQGALRRSLGGSGQ